MEFVDFDKLVFIEIDLVEHLLETQAFLPQHLEQVIKDVILGDHLLPLCLQLLDSLVVVHSVEGIELSLFNNSVPVGVDFQEQSSQLILLQSQVEVVAESYSEILQSNETDSGVQSLKGIAHSHGLLDALLDGLEHFQALQFLLETRGYAATISSCVRAFGKHRGLLHLLLAAVVDNAVVGEGRPESLDEGFTGDVAFAWFGQSFEEDQHLLVREPQVKPDERLLQL